MESAANAIGARLKAIRGAKSQKDFAEALNIALTTYQNYERGDRVPVAEVLVLLHSQGWNCNWLLTGDGPERLSDAASGPSQSLRPDTLKMAVTLAQEALDGLTLDPGDYAELVSLIYDALHNGLESARVLAFAKPAARGLGAKDGRESVGGPGAQAPGKG